MNFPVLKPTPEPIQLHHYQEWNQGSEVDPDIINLNVQSFNGDSILEILLSEALGQLGGHSNQYVTTPVKRLFENYATLTEGGWWCAGLDPLNNWEPMEWGQFKPDSPRPSSDKPGKVIKYEQPPKTPTRAHFLRVSFINSYKIAENYGEEAQTAWLARVEAALSSLTRTASNQEGEAAERGIARAQSEQWLSELHAACRRGEHREACRLLRALRDQQGGNHRHGIETENAEHPDRRGDQRPGWLIEDCGFWEWFASNPSTSFILTEGSKKAGKLLTEGRIAIALPGIFNGYRKATKRLIEDLAVVCAKGRPIYICFDHDTKEQTRRNVNIAISKLGKLFQMQGCQVNVIELPGPEKGVDDFVVARGREAFDLEVQNAVPFSRWQTRLYSRLTYGVDLELNQEKLGPFSMLGRQPKLMCFKSPKGSGKTHSLKEIVEQAKQRGQRVLVITHRVQLGQDICRRIGLPYISEAGVTKAGAPYGYGLCIDSLHPESQAQFDPEDWKDAIVVIDEVEQVLWHLLEANTDVRQHRLAILEQLQQVFIQTFQSENGQVIAMDADLTDVAINFILNLAEAKFYVKPYIVVNRYEEPNKRVCHHFDQSTPKEWFAALLRAIASGQRVVVVTQSQKKKSVWSAHNLQCLILKLFPDKRVLSIDSETIAEPDHPAYGVVSNLDAVLPRYDVVIATPTIETGVSFDIRGHFDSVWGCFWGVTSANSARQALARVRDDVPRYVWSVNRGKNQVANGATTKYGLRDAQVQMAQSALARLTQWWDNENGYSTDETALHTWSEMACRINSERYEYRRAIVDGMRGEGYRVESANFAATDDLPDWAMSLIDFDLLPADLTSEKAKIQLVKFFNQSIKTTRNHEYETDCRLQADEELISDEYGEILQKKRAKTAKERRQYQKWRKHKRYGGVPITFELIQKDDAGWYPQLQLAYYLSLGEPFLKERDAKILSRSARNGKLWYPSFSRSQLGNVAELYQLLKIEDLQDPNREYSNFDEDMIERERLARYYADDIKTLTGITIAEKDTPIAIANKLLKKLDLKLTQYRRTGGNGVPRPWMYIFIPPDDVRFDVFEKWYERDTLSRNESEVSPESLTNRSIAEAA